MRIIVTIEEKGEEIEAGRHRLGVAIQIAVERELEKILPVEQIEVKTKWEKSRD